MDTGAIWLPRGRGVLVVGFRLECRWSVGRSPCGRWESFVDSIGLRMGMVGRAGVGVRQPPHRVSHRGWRWRSSVVLCGPLRSRISRSSSLSSRLPSITRHGHPLSRIDACGVDPGFSRDGTPQLGQRGGSLGRASMISRDISIHGDQYDRSRHGYPVERSRAHRSSPRVAILIW